MRRPWLRFGKFGLVGLLGMVLQLALIALLTRFARWSSWTSTAVAVELTVVFNFILHERYTWGDRFVQDTRKRVARFWRFQAGNGLVSLAGNTLLTYCFVELLKRPVLPSALAAISLCSLVNFLLADEWVYS